MPNASEYNWQVCFEIEPDKDFWFSRIIPEWEDCPRVILDATDENVKAVIEQLMLASMTIDAKDYLKASGTESTFQNICQGLASILTTFHDYKLKYDEWIDFDVQAPCGNQSFAVAVLPDYMVDFSCRDWEYGTVSLYMEENVKDMVRSVEEFVEGLERGDEGFVPGSYVPPAIINV